MAPPEEARVLSPPDDLDPAALIATLTREWGVVVASMEYRPLGFGSHHWSVVDVAGVPWFATADELGGSGQRYAELRRALDAARALRAGGADFVVAPLTTAGDEPLARVDERHAVALYPLVAGDSFGFDEYDGDEHRHAIVDMVARVHAAPEPVCRRAGRDDLAVPHRAAMEATLDGKDVPEPGPYAAAVADLFAGHESSVRGLLAAYDDLAARTDLSRAVLTHGEPHPGNTMRTPDGWKLIDWDTTLVAPPERDLWMLGEEFAAAYAERTGVVPRPDLLRLFRMRWDLADLAVDAARFRRPHGDGPNEAEAFAVLRRVITSF